MKLLETGEVIGRYIGQALPGENHLDGNRLRYDIPFPVAWDKVVSKYQRAVSEEEILKIINRDIPNFESLPMVSQKVIRSQVEKLLEA